jgi:ABC-type phosphate/phosphonate transport system permease subunit
MPSSPAAVAGRELVATRPRPRSRSVLSVLLLAAFVLSVARVEFEGASGGVSVARDLLTSILRPDLSPDFLVIVAEATLLTAAYAVAGMSVAVLIGVPGALVVSGVLTRRRSVRAVSVVGARGLFATLRAVHELIWALLLLTILGLHPLAGILAIGIPYGATMARVLGDRLQDVPAAPLEALRAAGATPLQVLLYGRLPLAGADLAGYSFYRLECAVRAAAVLSFIGLGGIGFRIEIALADLRFEQVGTLLLALLLLVVAVDRVSRAVRARLVA